MDKSDLMIIPEADQISDQWEILGDNKCPSSEMFNHQTVDSQLSQAREKAALDEKTAHKNILRPALRDSKGDLD